MTKYNLRDGEVGILAGLENGPRYIDSFDDATGVDALLHDHLIEKTTDGLVIRLTHLGKKEIERYQ